jgi:hypothetical protein
MSTFGLIDAMNAFKKEQPVPFTFLITILKR